MILNMRNRKSCKTRIRLCLCLLLAICLVGCREHQLIVQDINAVKAVFSREMHCDKIIEISKDHCSMLVSELSLEKERPLVEELYTYEVWNHPVEHLVITGISDKYKDDFEESIVIPSDINGLPVYTIGEHAFKGMNITEVLLPSTILRIKEEAFAGCNLKTLELPANPIIIEKRAFAENTNLWAALIRDAESKIGEDAFINCDNSFFLCYEKASEDKENLVKEYAGENKIDVKEVVLSEPIINYPTEPLGLRPEILNFFYGEDGDEEKNQMFSWERDDEAPNWGFDEWQAPCSSWCGVQYFDQEITATSELVSLDGRYNVENILKQNREAAWAEGVKGTGIGESIVYRQLCSNLGVNNQWDAMLYDEDKNTNRDSFLRYTEICIVNGYAKNQKTWEENGRIKKLLMYIEGKPYAYLELEDTILPQYFKIPANDIIVPGNVMIEFRFEIHEVYPGTLYEDTCLTGLLMEFTGRPEH